MGLLDRLRNKPKTTSLADEEYKRAKATAELKMAPKRAERDVNMAYERESNALKSQQPKQGAIGKAGNAFSWAKNNLFTGDTSAALGYGGSGKGRKSSSGGGMMSALGYSSGFGGRSSGGGNNNMMSALGFSTPKSHHPKKNKPKYGRYRGKTVRLN